MRAPVVRRDTIDSTNDQEPAVCQCASVQISRMPLISLVGDIWKRTSKILRLGSSEIFVFGDLGRWSWVVGRGSWSWSWSGQCIWPLSRFRSTNMRPVKQDAMCEYTPSPRRQAQFYMYFRPPSPPRSKA